MRMPVEFRLLGGIEAEVDNHVVDLGPARQRLVLAALLLGMNRPMPAEHLISLYRSKTRYGLRCL
jgi:DNA-binding SARP family transcriptional activator